MPSGFLVALLGLVAFVASALATRALVPLLTRWQFIDHPNHRSSHALPTPRGGGLAPVAVLLGFGFALSWPAPGLGLPVLMLAAAVLALVSLRDDRRSLGVGPRLGAQLGVVLAGCVVAGWFWPPILPGLIAPLLLWPALALAWLWFVNAVNFMDGIDGISGVELASVGGGAALVIAFAGSPASPALASATMVGGVLLASVAGGFLTANWQPARVFLGDVGSVPLGFLAGALMVALAACGHPAAAAILPAYYVVDATMTLFLRIRRGEKLTEAHRSHAYQRALKGGLDHAGVCLRIAVLNLVLIGLALWAGTQPLTALVLAYAASFGLYGWLMRKGGSG